jgi:hypothetical protein
MTTGPTEGGGLPIAEIGRRQADKTDLSCAVLDMILIHFCHCFIYHYTLNSGISPLPTDALRVDLCSGNCCNREFRQATQEEQMIAEGCKRLIENSVICWNYLYLSQLIHDAKSEEEKRAIIEIIRNGSVVIWHHINMQGEYDFSDEYLKGATEFRLEDLLRLQFA